MRWQNAQFMSATATLANEHLPRIPQTHRACGPSVESTGLLILAEIPVYLSIYVRNSSAWCFEPARILLTPAE
jgi:hypothetical protein